MPDYQKRVSKEDYKAIVTDTSNYIWHEVCGKGRGIKEVLNELISE